MDESSLSDDSSLIEENCTFERLDGMETFPETTDKPRKRLRHPSEWARNKRKEKRAKGESYISSRKKVIPAITMKSACQNCRSKCNSKMSEEERSRIFTFYALADYNRQRNFIHSYTYKASKHRSTSVKSKRNFSITFFLPLQGKKVSV